MSIETKFHIPAYLFILIALFLCFKIGLPYIQNARFDNKVQKSVNYNKEVYSTPPDIWEVKDQILFDAKKLGIQIDPHRFNIQEIDKDIIVDIKYTSIVDLFVTKISIDFHLMNRSRL